MPVEPSAAPAPKSSRRSLYWQLALLLVLLALLLSGVISRYELGRWNPLGPAERVSFRERAYKLAAGVPGSQQEATEHGPQAVDQMRRFKPAWPDRAVLLPSDLLLDKITPTTIYLQTRDGRYWRYSLIGGP
jgi:hypothetical protein